MYNDILRLQVDEFLEAYEEPPSREMADFIVHENESDDDFVDLTKQKYIDEHEEEIFEAAAEQYKEEHRPNGLIFSGIYNSNSGINRLNQFIAAEKITMRVHILSVHQKARPFQCDECDYTCARLTNLNNHRTIMHAATNKLTLSDYGENITWNTVENMFSAQAIQKNSENQLFCTSEGAEKLPPSSVSVPTHQIIPEEIR